MKKLLVLLALCLLSPPLLATTSTVNPNVPAQNSTLSSSVVRNNFAATYNDINNLYSLIGSGGGGSPGGLNTYIQYNNGTTSFGADASLTYTTPGIINLGKIGTSTGKVNLAGATSGTITIAPQGTAGSYNFNLPNTAGTSGQVLTSQGGGSTAMTWATPTTNAGGTNTQVQYNASGGFGADSSFTYATPGVLTLGVNASHTGSLVLANGGGGGNSITIQNNSATSGFNFNLPATAGTSGFALISGGGGSSPMTWSAIPTVPVSVANGGTGNNPGLLSSPSSAAATVPASLTWTYESAIRRATLHSDMPPYAEVIFNNVVDTGLTIHAFSGSPTVGQGYMTCSTGVCTVGLGAGTTAAPPIVQPYFGVSVAMTFGGGATTNDWIGVGLVKDTTNNFLFGYVDNKANTWYISGKIAGTSYSTSPLSLPAAGYTRVGFSMSGSTLGVWGYNGTDWVLMQTKDMFTSGANLQTTNWTGWEYAVTSNNDAGNPTKFADLKAGPFGGMGLRDINFITNEDTSPYIVDGKLFFTATIASGATTNTDTHNISAASFGVYTFDPTTQQVVQVGNIFVKRTGHAGSPGVYGDSAGTIIFDRVHNNWIVMVSTWGDYEESGAAPTIAYQVYDSNPLYGTLIMANITSVGMGGYDPSIYWDGTNFNLLWIVNTTNGIELRKATTLAGLSGASDIAMTGGLFYEGAKFHQIGGTIYVASALFSTGNLWSLSGTNLGAFGPALASSSISYQGNIISYPSQLGTIYYYTTFTGTQLKDYAGTAIHFSHGATYTFASAPVTGQEFPHYNFSPQ